MRYERYVAIGDSTTEGLDDPDGSGGYRGWANRLAAHLAEHQGEVAYANLAVRGMCARQIRETQLAPALAMRPDLATVVAGMNDLLRARFDARAIARDLGEMQRALRAGGCTVITFTLPDLSPRLAPRPLDRVLSHRTRVLDDAIREVSQATGTMVFDLARYPLAVDPRLWSRDRLHANAEGHRRTAAALAQMLALSGSDDTWLAPLPAAPPTGLRERLADEARWSRDFLLPWLWRRVRARPISERAKLPALTRVTRGCASS